MPVLLVCDHASNHVPKELSGLGLTEAELGLHIGWDIGAAAVTRIVSGLLPATAILSGVSRLVIDCNRPLDDPTSIPKVSDGVAVPGNHRLGVGVANSRCRTWFKPYHEAVAAQLARLERGADAAALISIHSFTPVMNGKVRPWPVGILWNRDPRLARPVIDALRREGLDVGDNEPYSGRVGGYTMRAHGHAHGRPHLAFEIRQDLITDDGGARKWARLVGKVLARALVNPDLHLRRHY